MLRCLVVISLVNRKGGTGKTTSAAYIAQCLYREGQDVLGLDLDEERSWSKWGQTKALPYPVVPLKIDRLADQVNQHRGTVVIDTPPNDGEVVLEAAMLSDEIIIPLSATALDLNRLITTLQGVEKVERLRRQPLASVLFTRWQGQHLLSQEALMTLAERKVPVLDARIRQLTRYAGFGTPGYLDEYRAVLTEIGVLGAQA